MIVLVSLIEAAKQVLREARKPLYYGDIVQRAQQGGLIPSAEADVSITMNAVLLQEMAAHGGESVFVQPQEDMFGLREWEEDTES